MTLARVIHLHRVLEPDLEAWEALGWREVARDRVPSVAVAVIVIEYEGETVPVPERGES